MKRLLFVFALAAFGAVSSFAQTPAQPTKTEVTTPAEGAVMTFDQELVDYGVIEYNSDPFRYFNFTNTGTEPLIISNARGSCGCTVPTYPTDPIMPGETGQIKVKYDTKRAGSKFTKFVTLTTNEANPTRKLTIKGEVLPKPKEESVPAENSLFNGGSGQ
ncbi:MAG: DUF1573 domain-containing protein [Bacteroidota bacterium]